MKLPKVDTINIKISDLKMLEAKNPNSMKESKYANLKGNIKKYGFLQPIVVYKSGKHYTLIDGFHRQKVMKELGQKEIAAYVANSAEDAEELARILRIAMNNVRGESSFESLADEISDLLAKGVDIGELPDTGMSLEDIAIIEEASSIVLEEVMSEVVTTDEDIKDLLKEAGTSEITFKVSLNFDCAKKKAEFEDWCLENARGQSREDALLDALGIG